MRVLICGDRNYTDYWRVFRYIETLDAINDIIISGMAEGADTYAYDIAKAKHIDTMSFFPKWDHYMKLTGYWSAGSIRNQRMLGEGKPDLVVYFHDDIKNSKGTKNMVERAQKAGIPVLANPTGDEELPDSLKDHPYAAIPNFCFGCGHGHEADYADCVWEKEL